ncbi:histidinol-phosphate transaminase [Plantibacter sp. YIM 135347]|uniref:histidinol-phosphate transaminase n=1 Tax=Plantibacter sp. YIM 135347 TaxID=3423919 RepID=UPI003D34CABA
MPAPDRPRTPQLRAVVGGLPGYVPGRRADEAAIAALASNESHFDPLPSVLASVLDRAATLNRYPEFDSATLRGALADRLGVSADEVSAGPGSVGVLQQIILAMCDAGDEVVFAWRSFEAYPILVRVAGAVPVPVSLRADEAHDLDAMLAAVTERTRVVILCTPNNPTGVALTHDEIEDFVSRVPAHVLVVIDEAYTEYAAGPDAVDAIAISRAFPSVCVLRTFSKAYGLAGLRVGYAIARAEIAEGLRRTATPFGVSAVAQAAAIASLGASDELQDRVDHVLVERARLIAAARDAGWDVPDSHANFIWLRTDDELQHRLTDAFDDADILVRAYPGDGVRISIADAASNDRVVRVLQRIASHVPVSPVAPIGTAPTAPALVLTTNRTS